MYFHHANPILLFIMLPAGANVYRAWRDRKKPQQYYEVDRKTKVKMALLYFGLVAFLAISMRLTHVQG